MDGRRSIQIAFTVLAWLLFPKDAHAWGPVVHLDSATQVLFGAVAVAPVIMDLLKKHSFDFLYGAIAADSIIGKQHAKHHEHCHNWEVARELLRVARRHGGHREAFMLGYIDHLGADVVAHNHIVPQMMVVHYRAKRAGHLYWEARADYRVSMLNPKLHDIWQALSQMRFPGHDRFLRDRLVPTIMSNRLSHTLYRSNLTLQRNEMWRKALSRIDVKSKLYFKQKDLLLWRQLAAQTGARAVDNPWSQRLDHLDPTGAAALAWAKSSRRALRRELRRNGDTPNLDKALRNALAQTKTIDIHHFEEDWAEPAAR
jgi:hypothetical protein